MFRYNWQVRDEWFTWCEALSLEELQQERVGGVGSILKTLYHVIDCEQLWINHMQNTPIIQSEINNISSLEEVMLYGKTTRTTTENFFEAWNPEMDRKILQITSKNGTIYSFPYGKVIRHIISHEIHHIGQLSVWARELGMKPISSDLIFRDFS